MNFQCIDDVKRGIVTFIDIEYCEGPDTLASYKKCVGGSLHCPRSVSEKSFTFFDINSSTIS